MSITQLGITAARGALGRSFLIEKRPDGVPRVIIIFDAITSEIPEFQADVTLIPTESGQELTDHIQIRNPTLKMDGTISETPIDLEVQALNLAGGGLDAITNNQQRTNFLNAGLGSIGGVAGASLLGNSASPFADAGSGLTDTIARTSMLSAYERRAIFTVVTRRQQYENTVIQSMTFPKTTDTGRQ